MLSFEDTTYSQAGLLGIDYTDNVDTRWEGTMCLGPEINTLTLSTHDGANVPANVVGFAKSETMNATKFIYVARGIPIAKVKASDMTLVDPGTVIALAENATDIIYTKSANNTEEISIGMASTAYHVITASAAAGMADTSSANNGSELVRIFGYATPANRVAGLGKGTGSVENLVRANVLTGSVTMDACNWATVMTLAGEVTTFTGFTTDGNFWIVGTSNGPYFHDSDFEEARPLIDEIDNDPDNCKQMGRWYTMGVICPLADGTRYFRTIKSGESFGPEMYLGNTSPVQGRMTAHAGTTKWLYGAFHNAEDDITYLCAMRPRKPGDWHINPVSIYPLAKLASGIECTAMEYIGKYGGRDNPTMIGGNDSNMWWFTIGRTSREIDDSNYRFALSGTAYLTEMRRDPLYWKEVEWVEFETSGCTSARTVTVKISADGGTAVQVGAVVKSNGIQRLRVAPGERIYGARLKPEIAFATDADTASPKIEGTVRVGYRRIPTEVDGATR